MKPYKTFRSLNNEIGHMNLVYEGLIRLGKNPKAIPTAAEKWSYNADSTEIIFTYV